MSENNPRLYECPICHKRYTWDGNFCGLMLLDWGDAQPFVCNDCEEEGQRRNRGMPQQREMADENY